MSRTSHPKIMSLIGSEKMPSAWSQRLEELIVCAITGERSGVVEKLDALVKGYRPAYEFHGVPVPGTVSPESDPPRPSVSTPSKSVH